MNDIRTVKLENAGDKVTMVVERVVFNPKSDKIRYPDFTFTGTSNNERIRVNVPEVATRRQCERMNLFPEQLDKATITISRDPSNDPAKPYWGIVLAAPHEAKPAVPSKRMTEPPKESVSAEDRGSDGKGVPGDAPPAHHREAGVPVEEAPAAAGGGEEQLSLEQSAVLTESMTAEPGKAPSIKAQKVDQVDRAIRHAWELACSIQGDKGTADSLQAMTATTIISYKECGVFR